MLQIKLVMLLKTLLNDPILTTMIALVLLSNTFSLIVKYIQTFQETTMIRFILGIVVSCG